MKTWDAIIVGGGIIGLSLALSLRRYGAHVIILDRHQLGHEASFAAGGMLADCEAHEKLKSIAVASANAYPAFVETLQDESGVKIDFRDQGTLQFAAEEDLAQLCRGGRFLSADRINHVERGLSYTGPAVLLDERSVDPRSLLRACLLAAKHLGLDMASGATVVGIEMDEEGAVGVRTSKTVYHGNAIINCGGAWAGTFGPVPIPARPVKGHMLSVIPETYDGGQPLSEPPAPRMLIEHVIRTKDVYMVPRSDGRVVIGSTIEDAGYNKSVDIDTIQQLLKKAVHILPAIGQCRISESWTGLRPATPDKLPIMGRTEINGYFVSTGHYRDGILLAPASAIQMSKLVRGVEPDFDLSDFSPSRFGSNI